MNCEIHVLSQSAFGMDHFVLREEVWSLDIVKIERSEKSEEKIAWNKPFACYEVTFFYLMKLPDPIYQFLIG